MSYNSLPEGRHLCLGRIPAAHEPRRAGPSPIEQESRLLQRRQRSRRRDSLPLHRGCDAAALTAPKGMLLVSTPTSMQDTCPERCCCGTWARSVTGRTSISRPHRSAASRRRSADPTTTHRTEGRGAQRALTTTSGPTPAGSPIVIANVCKDPFMSDTPFPSRAPVGPGEPACRRLRSCRTSVSTAAPACPAGARHRLRLRARR